MIEINEKIIHFFIDEDYIGIDKSKIDKDNYKGYINEEYDVDEYSSYKEIYDNIIQVDIVDDFKYKQLLDSEGNWNFFISFEELKILGYASEVRFYFPLIEKYIVDDETDFYDYFSLEQLKDFEESLHLYYETDDIDTNKWGELYSKSNKAFNNNIISLSEGMIDYNDFILDYKATSYDLLLDNVVAYFRENQIKNLMEYGSDSDEGLYHLSSMYQEIMDKLGVKYSNVYTEDVSDGKYLTTIIFENDSSIKVDTSARNGIEVVTENMKSIYEKYEKILNKTKENENKNEQKFDYDYD